MLLGALRGVRADHLLGSRTELAEVINLGARGLLTPTVARYSLQDAVTAYQDLAAGKLIGRAVIVP